MQHVMPLIPSASDPTLCAPFPGLQTLRVRLCAQEERPRPTPPTALDCPVHYEAEA